MIKILIGGSPCTYWSIAQKNNRETEASGMGWELFKNYLIAKEKFQPDFFLYENNKSAAQPIKDQIKLELGVEQTDPEQLEGQINLFTDDTGARYIEINSALVSAQNRQRFYVHNCGDVQQPEDRGILLKDILEVGGVTDMDKSRTMTASVGRTTEREHFVKHQNTMVAEPVSVGWRGRGGKGKWEKQYEAREDNKANAITTATSDSMVACPVRVGSLPREDGELTDSKQYRIYSVDEKATTQCGQGGGMGAKTGLYAVELSEREMDYMVRDHQDQRWSFLNRPAEDDKSKCVVANYSKGVPYNVLAEPINVTDDGKSQTIKAQYDRTSVANICAYSSTYGATGIAEPTDEEQDEQYAGDGKDQNAMRRVYEVKDGLITIKGKQYPIKLADGCYRIRKLTVKECCRLQTMPDDYCRAVSNSQAYKGLGNGWTAEVIIHILNEALKDVPKDEEIVVLSMYDGIGTGRYCLDKMGFTNVKYYAYEIDKYAMQIAKSNYPDIIECGDAFQLRNDDWSIGYGSFT